MPCPFTGPKIFCAGPNFLSQTKNLTAYSSSSKPFVLAQKPILLNANHLFAWHKKIGPAQNILGPVKGQGISSSQPFYVYNLLLLPKVTRISGWPKKPMNFSDFNAVQHS